MKMGFAKTDITPPLPCRLGGYELQRQAATAVHRPLYARTMAGEAAGIRFAIVSLDLLGVDARLRDQICAAAAKTAGIPADRISLIASHTHSAIEGIPDVLNRGHWTAGRDHVPAAYRSRLVDTITADIRKAIDGAREARIRWYRADCPGIAGNRRKRDGWADSWVHWMKAFAADSGEPMGGLLHFACHPTVIGPEAGVVSPDFPGVLQEELEADSRGIFLYANGAAGDISTRFTRQGTGPPEADRLGRLLLAALGRAETVDVASAAFPAYASKLIPFVLTDRKTGSPIRTNLQIATVGGMTLWLIPGEPFSSFARQLQESRRDHLVVGFANDYIGYIPDAQSWPEGGYEVEVSRIGFDDSDTMWRCFQ